MHKDADAGSVCEDCKPKTVALPGGTWCFKCNKSLCQCLKPKQMKGGEEDENF